MTTAPDPGQRSPLAEGWPAGTFICIDADCPSCGWAERRYNPMTCEFSCSKCDYVSMERDS